LLETFAPRDSQFVLEVNIGSGQEGVNAGVSGGLHGLASSLDVFTAAPGQGGDHGPPHRASYSLHGAEIAFGRYWESRLDDIDTQTVKLASHAQFFRRRHAAARRLFAIS
jgi:hypothetical protein